jgi:DEAD/DEAH box helicase
MTQSQNITVLTATSSNTVKTYYNDAEGQLKCQQYGNEMYFNYSLVQVQGIAQFSTLLITLSKRKNAILIRGTPRPGLPKLVLRQKVNFPEDEAGRFWVMLDFDNLPVPEGMNPNSEEAIEYYILKLPKEFHDVSYFYQFSSSAGILNSDGTPLKKGLNVHLFFWFKHPIHGKRLSAYFESNCYDTGFYKKALDRNGMPEIRTGVDLSVIRSSVQPHYIGLPNMLKGVKSTLPPEDRQRLVRKRSDAVELPELADSLVPETLTMRRRILNAWKVECGFVSARITTRAAHGGISVSSYYRNPNDPSPSTNRVFTEAKPYGANEDAVILYFEGEISPGSFYVKKTSPQLAIRFGDYSSIPLKELSDGAYAHVRDELKWFTEIRHVELPLTEAGYMPDISSLPAARNTLIESPTGSGKTQAFCRYAKSKNTVIIYAAQTIALVDQMHADLTKNGRFRAVSKSRQFNVPWAVRYTDFYTGAPLQNGVVYVTTNASLHKFIDAAIEQGVNYELCIDEIHVALDDFMASNRMNELLEKAIGRATRSIFMTGTITNLQITKLVDTVSRACGVLTPEVYAGYRFHPVKTNPLFLADVSNFGADFVALLRQYQALKIARKPIPRTVIITPSTKMRVYEMLLEKFGLLEDSCVVSRQESLQDKIEVARVSRLPILISSPLFALGLNFEAEPVIFWTFFSYLKVDESQIIQTLNRANRGGVQCEVRLYVGETDERPVIVPDAVLEQLKIEEYLRDEATVQGVLDAHFQIDRAAYLSLREAEKKTAKSQHNLIENDGFQNYRIQHEWVDTLEPTKEDKELFDRFKKLAAAAYLDDVTEHANCHSHDPDTLLLHYLEKLYQRKKEFGEAVVQVGREIENEERGIIMDLCNVSARDSASVKPARIRRLFAELKPYLTAQFHYEKTGEWRNAAAEKTLALIPLLVCLKKMKARQVTGYTFATLMKRPSLRNAVKALADNEVDYLAWQKKLARLDVISDQIRNNASDRQKATLKSEQFKIAEDFLKTIGVTFFKDKIGDVWITFPNIPFVPNWDFDSMIAVLRRKAESLKRLPEKPVDKEFEEEHWVGANVGRELCASCVHCSRDYFCALGRPIQPFWDDIEATTEDCDLYRKIPAKLEAWEPTKI